jgi:general secretion pathway protein J
MNNIRHKQGFTLIEILVALAIFAVIGVVAASCLHQMIGYRARLINQSDQWRTLAIARLLIQKDFSNAIDLGPLDVDSALLPGFSGQSSQLTFTRYNHANAALASDSAVFEGVTYSLSNRQLIRSTTDLNYKSSSSIVLDGVNDIQWYYLDSSKQWVQQWDMNSSNNFSQRWMDISLLPQAMRVIIKLKGIGTVQWDFTKPLVSG